MKKSKKSETATVTASISESGDKVLEYSTGEKLATKTLERPAEVSISVGLTLNLGNYESARIDVGLKLPCEPDDIDTVYAYTEQWVEARLETEVAKVKEFLKEKDRF